MTKTTYKVFIIQGYENLGQDGRLEDTITMELIDKDLESALKRAAQIAPKKFYRLSGVIEKHYE